ncbi:MAG: Resolvase domain protein [Xanthobacteraceae bacterium]|jgi:DNA invertase Pin-like site-specific DNA recombinase|nr:Resolvase domain protein [Xanthobacteraceae bacterium]
MTATTTSTGHLIGYGRTSTVEQEAGLEAQRRDLEAAGCQKVFTERASSVGDRPVLARALEYVREGDTLVVTKIDRLARSTIHLWEIVRDLNDKGVNLRVLSLGARRSTRASPPIGLSSTPSLDICPV